MRCHLTVATTLLAAASLAAAGPAMAAKPKPKPITGTYTASLPPDPTKEVGSLQEKPACSGLSPMSINHHAFTVPAAGTLTVTLDGEDPTKGGVPTPLGNAGLDWDLYVLDAEGVVGESDGGTAHEQVVVSFKKKSVLDLQICNLDGLPNGTVTYRFDYK